jgi:hypothetical protein
MKWQEVLQTKLDRSFLLFFTIDMAILAAIGLVAVAKDW